MAHPRGDILIEVEDGTLDASGSWKSDWFESSDIPFIAAAGTGMNFGNIGVEGSHDGVNVAAGTGVTISNSSGTTYISARYFRVTILGSANGTFNLTVRALPSA